MSRDFVGALLQLNAEKGVPREHLILTISDAIESAYRRIPGNEDVRDRLEQNAQVWRRLLTEAGFDIKAGESPIVPVMLYNAKLAQDVARDLFAEEVYVVGFFFPVVPKGQARIRTQLSAAHTTAHLDRAIAAFRKGGKTHDILGKSKNEIVDRYGL